MGAIRWILQLFETYGSARRYRVLRGQRKWMESLKVNTIVDNLDPHFFQERLLDEISHPIRTRNNRQILVGSKQRFLQIEVLTRAIFELVSLWTVTTFRLPLHTVLLHEVIAMACESPTIVECPNHLDIRLVKIFKQQTIVEEMVVDVMQLNHIWLEKLYLLDQLFCSMRRTSAFQIQQAIAGIVDIGIPSAPHLD